MTFTRCATFPSHSRQVQERHTNHQASLNEDGMEWIFPRLKLLKLLALSILVQSKKVARENIVALRPGKNCYPHMYNSSKPLHAILTLIEMLSFLVEGQTEDSAIRRVCVLSAIMLWVRLDTLYKFGIVFNRFMRSTLKIWLIYLLNLFV